MEYCPIGLILTRITVCSAIFHLLLLEFDILELWPAAHPMSLTYQSVERPNLQGTMTFPTLCFTPERWMGSRMQLTVGCFTEL